jgi:hypothetical protein
VTVKGPQTFTDVSETNEKRKETKMEEQIGTELVKVDFNEYLATVEPVSAEVVDEVCSDAQTQITWGKVTAGGILIGEDTIPRLQGVIHHIRPHWIKWDDKTPEKKEDITNVPDPDSWERRCDVHVLTLPGLLVGLSMPKTSYSRFAQYVNMLQHEGWNPVDVVTEIWPTERKGPLGVYNVLNFKAVKFLKEKPSNGDDIPF